MVHKQIRTQALTKLKENRKTIGNIVNYTHITTDTKAAIETINEVLISLLESEG